MDEVVEKQIEMIVFRLSILEKDIDADLKDTQSNTEIKDGERSP